MKPRYFFCGEGLDNVWNQFGLFFSDKFCRYFSDNVERIIVSATGIKASYKVGLSLFPPQNGLPMYEPGPVSRINTAISILPMYYGYITFLWRSKTGKVVKTTDEDFDEEDLECWVEGIDAAEYWKQLNKKTESHPFTIKDLPFELEVIDFGTHMALDIELNGAEPNDKIKQALEECIEKFNSNSELKNREDGVVHNYSFSDEGDNLTLRIDTGSAGVAIIKKLLHVLKKIPGINKVKLDL